MLIGTEHSILSLANVILVDDKFTSLHQYLRYCHKSVTIVFASMVSARLCLFEYAIYSAVQTISRINSMLKWWRASAGRYRPAMCSISNPYWNHSQLTPWHPHAILVSPTRDAGSERVMMSRCIQLWGQFVQQASYCKRIGPIKPWLSHR